MDEEKARDQEEREARDRRDLEILNREAERLNREVEDVLGYQRLPSFLKNRDGLLMHRGKLPAGAAWENLIADERDERSRKVRGSDQA